jgi:hypothetical protein
VLLYHGSGSTEAQLVGQYNSAIWGLLWKDADPDIPILKEAKTEYARLQ